MAYTHNQYEVRLTPRNAVSAGAVGGAYGFNPSAVTGLTPSLGGIAMWSPGIIPHQVHAVAVAPQNDVPTQLAAVSSQPRFKFHLCVTHGSVTVHTASDVFNTLSIPTTVTGGAMWQCKSIVNYVTQSVIVRPGNVVKLTCSAYAAGNYNAFLLVSPAWDTVAGSTSAFAGPGAS